MSTYQFVMSGIIVGGSSAVIFLYALFGSLVTLKGEK